MSICFACRFCGFSAAGGSHEKGIASLIPAHFYSNGMSKTMPGVGSAEIAQASLRSGSGQADGLSPWGIEGCCDETTEASFFRSATLNRKESGTETIDNGWIISLLKNHEPTDRRQ